MSWHRKETREQNTSSPKAFGVTGKQFSDLACMQKPSGRVPFTLTRSFGTFRSGLVHGAREGGSVSSVNWTKVSILVFRYRLRSRPTSPSIRSLNRTATAVSSLYGFKRHPNQSEQRCGQEVYRKSEPDC